MADSKKSPALTVLKAMADRATADVPVSTEVEVGSSVSTDSFDRIISSLARTDMKRARELHRIIYRKQRAAE